MLARRVLARRVLARRVLARRVLRSRGIRSLDDGDGFPGGGQAVGARVELGGGLAQRQVGLRGEDQRDQPGAQVQVAVDQAEADPDRHHRDRQGRDELEHQGGKERDAQRAHGGAPVVAGDLADDLSLRLGPAEHLERRQPGHHVEEVVREHRQRAPALLRVRAGGLPDQRAEQRDERQGRGDRQPGERVGPADPDQDRDRHHGGQHELRQVLGEVAVERLDPVGGQRGQLGVPLPGQPARPELGGPGEQATAQFGLDRRARVVGRGLGDPGHDDPAGHHRGQRDQGPAQRRDRGAVLERRGDADGQQLRLHDDQGRGQHAEPADRSDVHPGRAGVPEQPRVKRLHRVAVSGCCAWGACGGFCGGAPIRLRKTQ